jgi:hypothetical protein
MLDSISSSHVTESDCVKIRKNYLGYLTLTEENLLKPSEDAHIKLAVPCWTSTAPVHMLHKQPISVTCAYQSCRIPDSWTVVCVSWGWAPVEAGGERGCSSKGVVHILWRAVWSRRRGSEEMWVEQQERLNVNAPWWLRRASSVSGLREQCWVVQLLLSKECLQDTCDPAPELTPHFHVWL